MLFGQLRRLGRFAPGEQSDGRGHVARRVVQGQLEDRRSRQLLGQRFGFVFEELLLLRQVDVAVVGSASEAASFAQRGSAAKLVVVP